MHLLWSFLAGLGPGVLAVLLISLESTTPVIVGGGLAGGLLLLMGVWGLERGSGYEPERGRHLAQASSVALFSWTAIGALLLDLPPHGALAAVLALVALALALWLAIRRSGPAPGILRHLGMLLAGLIAFELVLVIVAAASPVLFGIRSLVPGAFASGAYDVDASVALEPRLSCESGAPEVATLADRGAHPRLAGEGRFVFFDAEVEGERQVFRLDREEGVERCLTCGQPGGNRRPAPNAEGTALVFDTDRHRSWRHPMNTEIYALEIRDDDRKRSAIRLTRDLRPDDHALYDPSGRGVLWTRTLGPEFAVVRGAIRGGHGGIILTGTSLVRKGGMRWPGALAWAPDARALAIGFGHAAQPLDLEVWDPATEDPVAAVSDAATTASVSFSRDGSRMAVATTTPSGAASLLPKRLGFLLARLEPLLSPDGVTGPGETLLFVGPRGDLAAVELGDVGVWGAPTGASLSPRGDALVLGQRRSGPDGVEERLVWLELDCQDDPDPAP